MLTKVVLQSLAADFLDQLAEPVGTDSIFPSRSGIKQERRLQKAIVSLARTGDSPGGHIRVQLRIEKFVGEPGGVRKQLPDGGRRFRRSELCFSRAGIEFLKNLHLGKLREVGRHRFIDRKSTRLNSVTV